MTRPVYSQGCSSFPQNGHPAIPPFHSRATFAPSTVIERPPTAALPMPRTVL